MSSLQAVCSNQALAQRLRRDGFAILETQKTWNHPPWLKCSLCFWFSLVAPVAACQKVNFWKGSWKKLGFAVGCFLYKVASNGVERKSPVPIMWMASVPPHSSLPCVLSFSCQWRREVQHWGCIQGRSLGKLVKGSEPCDWWTRLLNHIRRTGHGTGGLQSECTKLAIKDFCTAEDPIWL